MSQARQLGRMLMSKDLVGQVKHGLTLPKSKELWKNETIVWFVLEEECGTQGKSKRVGEEKSGAKGNKD